MRNHSAVRSAGRDLRKDLRAVARDTESLLKATADIAEGPIQTAREQAQKAIDLAKKFPEFHVVVVSESPDLPPHELKAIPGVRPLIVTVGHKGMSVIVLGLRRRRRAALLNSGIVFSLIAGIFSTTLLAILFISPDTQVSFCLSRLTSGRRISGASRCEAS